MQAARKSVATDSRAYDHHRMSEVIAMGDRICSVEDCEREDHCGGLCGAHYKRLKDGKPLGSGFPARDLCSAADCGRQQYSRTFCSMHLKRWQKHGDPLLGAARKQAVVCTASGCSDPARASDLCVKHYSRMRLRGELEPSPLPRNVKIKRVGVDPCEVPGCKGLLKARGFCKMHYSRWRRHGTADLPRQPGEVVDGKRLCSKCGDDVPCAEIFNSLCSPCWGETNRRRQAERRAFRVNPSGSVERFTRADVMERDLWVCQICGGRIDPACKWPNPLSPSLDHVLPLSRGGEHTMANSQASHLKCNLRKWAHIPVGLATSRLACDAEGDEQETQDADDEAQRPHQIGSTPAI